MERAFGLSVGAVLVGLGCWWFFRHKFASLQLDFIALGALLLATGLAYPRALVLPCRYWMKLAGGMAFVMTRVILFIVFFGVVTPIGLVRRLLGADPLDRRAPISASYWVEYPPRQRDLRHYDKMY